MIHKKAGTKLFNEMEEQVGPTIRRINRTEKRCGMCKYHENYMRHSGMNPVYDHYCSHPEATAETLFVFQHDEGRHIGIEDETPDWCPVNKTIASNT